VDETEFPFNNIPSKFIATKGARNVACRSADGVFCSALLWFSGELDTGKYSKVPMLNQVPRQEAVSCA